MTLPLPQNIASLTPYSSARSQLKGDRWLFLDANESPFPGRDGPIPLASLNRYPDPTADALRDAISSTYGVRRGNVIVSNGADELIDLAVRSFVRPGRSVLSPAPSYGFYKVTADLNGVPFLTVPLREDFTCDPRALAQCSKADVLFLCTPNNPTGSVIARTDIELILASFPGLVVVDEAYGEFADAQNIPSSIELVNAGARNLLVLRTFSKAFGAAGLRLGYGIACDDIINVLLKTKPPYNVGSVTQMIGLALWNDRARMQENVKIILAERDRMMAKCTALGCRVLPTFANFLLVEFPRTVRCDEIHRRLRDEFAISVRRFDVLSPKNILRFSIGSPTENDRLLTSLSSLV